MSSEKWGRDGLFCWDESAVDSRVQMSKNNRDAAITGDL